MSTQAGIRFLGLNLQAGTRRLFVNHWLLASFAGIMLASFLPQMQAFMFSEFLHLPEELHGRTAGMLNFWQEIVIIAVMAIVGPLSDQVGRKPFMAGGFAVMALGTALHPQAATVGELLAYRCIFAAGMAAVTVMMVTLMADYVNDESRGKAAGFQGMMNGFGAMVAVFLLLRLPAVFQRGGATPVEAGAETYYIGAGIALAFAVLMGLGLKPGRPAAAIAAKQPFMALARAGYRAAARDPRIALAYAASFIARGNLAIVGTFLALWGTNYGTTVAGMVRADALAKSGALIGMAQGMALLGAPLFGLLADKVDRVRALSVALLASGIGYGSTFFVDNPFGGLMIFSAIFIGLGEVGCIITSGVLVAQQSPEAERGAIIGTFNLCGAVGILVASVAGGWLFDHWREPGPFVAFGALALVTLAAALALSRRETARGNRGPSRTFPAGATAPPAQE